MKVSVWEGEGGVRGQCQDQDQDSKGRHESGRLGLYIPAPAWRQGWLGPGGGGKKRT